MLQLSLGWCSLHLEFWFWNWSLTGSDSLCFSNKHYLFGKWLRWYQRFSERTFMHLIWESSQTMMFKFENHFSFFGAQQYNIINIPHYNKLINSLPFSSITKKKKLNYHLQINNHFNTLVNYKYVVKWLNQRAVKTKISQSSPTLLMLHSPPGLSNPCFMKTRSSNNDVISLCVNNRFREKKLLGWSSSSVKTDWDKDQIGDGKLQWSSPRYKRLIKQIVVDII